MNPRLFEAGRGRGGFIPEQFNGCGQKGKVNLP
jgi:hypothetical protein